MSRYSILLVLCASVFCASAASAAGLIDFETLPGGGVPTDNTVLSSPYNLVGGGTVQFFFDANGNNTYESGVDQDPIIEAVGPDGTDGFSTQTLGTADTPVPAAAGGLGSFFLRQVTPGPPPTFPFIVDYNTAQTISALSGEIWDIDGQSQATEEWRVEVLNSVGGVLATQTSPTGVDSTLDGRPWLFSFSGLPLGVDKVRITWQGTKTGGVGFAFDNFSPFETPEPTSIALLALGSGAILLFRSKRSE